MKSLRMKTLIFFAFSFIAEIITDSVCTIPDGCFIQSLKYQINIYGFEKKFHQHEFHLIKCYPQIENFQFKFIENDFMTMMKNRSKHLCQIDGHIDYEYMFIQWPKSDNKISILDNNLI